MLKLIQLKEYGFRIFDLENKLLDEIKHPGDPGYWLSTGSSYPFMAILPISIKDYLSKEIANKYYRVERYKIDSQNIEIKDTTEDIVMIEIDSLSDVFDLAENLGIDYFYWSEWDYSRTLIILNTKGSRDPYKDNEFVYYTNEY
jgi:hypothetical protein